MTMGSYLAQHSISRYQLSKNSGIPWATLSDICSGKTKLSRCSGATLMKLAQALGLSIEDLLQMESDTVGNEETMSQSSKGYCEPGLTPSLRKAIEDYENGIKNNSSVLDCLWGELYGTINAHQHAGVISKEQADRLRAKYLFDGEEYVD